MKFLKSILSFSITLVMIFNFSPSRANNPVYEQRRIDYVNNALLNFNNNAITLQAYMGVPVDSARLQDILAAVPTRANVDFDLVQLVRILFLSTGQYDTTILPVIDTLPYWMNKGDLMHGYWSENHMIQWISSDWLLHEKYGKPIDASLDNRLRHYLQLKVDYGFYEFFSSTYAPYCLAGLLNLADFAQDTEIKTLATLAAQRLLKDILKLTNDKGVFFPVAGRNYYGRYETPYGQNHNHLIYLLTGFGQVPTGTSHIGGFLASSTLPVDSIIDSWTTDLDMTYHIGHTLDTGFILNSTQTPVDKTVFQWSSGAYFHPDVAAQTAQFLGDSNLWQHIDFSVFSQFSGFSIPTIVSLSNSLSVASKSTLICGQDLVLYKHNSLTLSSIKDFWKGKVGYQQFPCVANVGTTAVFTASGVVDSVWENRNPKNANDNLPYVGQNKNVALIMYRPEFRSFLLPFQNPEVALHFKTQDFDEVRNDSLWLLGRQDERYVAVRRHCLDSINGVPGCLMNNGQTWVIILGDSSMYNDFNSFQNKISISQFQERWYLDTVAQPNQWVYYSKIVFDTTTVEYAWGVDSIAPTAIENLKRNGDLNIYPNPSNGVVNIDLSAFINQPVSIHVTNILGQNIYAEKSVLQNGIKALQTTLWAQGVYFISIETAQGKFVQQFIRQE